MVKINNISGKKLIKVLTKYFSFSLISQKGSHIKMRKQTNFEKITVIIPNHKELSPWTLNGILQQAHIKPEEFIKYL